jgi:glycosyltransferase involved in cell wall biosynthesis
MRVAFLLTQDRGGPVDLTVELANELASRCDGPEIAVVGPPPAACAGRPWSLLHPLAVRSKIDARGFGAVAKVLRQLAPDIIHAQDRRAGLVSAVVAGHTPVLLTFHGVPDSAAGRWVSGGPLQGRRPGLAGSSRLLADALVARRHGYTVAPSRAMADFLRRELRVPANRLGVVRNGVALPSASKPVGNIEVFATAGSFAPSKATWLLVEAFKRVADWRANVRLIMLGDGADRQRCEGLATGSNGRIEFPGYRVDVADQLTRADAFVLPSLNENQPLALLQAMAAGLPCIASDVGGVGEVLEGGAGILVPPGDVGALTAAMQLLIADPHRAAALGAAARRRVEERFSVSRCADAHMALWSNILRGADEATSPVSTPLIRG